jgi:hypothetical protein
VKEWLSGRRPTANVFYRRRELQAAVRLEAASTLRSRMAAAPVLTLIGQTLREMRTVRGMTQQQLAITLVRLAAALGVLPAELFRAFTKHVMRSVS